MNVLFIGLEQIDNINDRGIYTDFLREVVKHGHSLSVLTANEKRNRITYSKNKNINNVEYILAKTGNITKNSHFFSKGVSIMLAGWQYIFALLSSKKKFDLVICTTPCITFERAMRYAKRKGKGKSILLLKDLWPYDLVFDGILTRTGIKGIIYRYLERISLRLFDSSDCIGCMTPRNKEFLETVYNSHLELDKACIIPNSIEPLEYAPSSNELDEIRHRYNIPLNKTVFVYGGNLGVAQGPDFIIEALLYSAKIHKDAVFIIVGNGTEYQRLYDAFIGTNNIKCFHAIPRDDYEKLVYACDVGLVFLNWNCHSPNVPSRILQYMQASIPVLCATDDTTDIGSIVTNNGFGLSCNSNDVIGFNECVNSLLDPHVRKNMGRKARKFVEDEYSATRTYSLIMNCL